ncbi:MAG: hypothetical protein ACJA1B_003005 [Polaribacter sp.]|jgi:hypothetical protein
MKINKNCLYHFTYSIGVSVVCKLSISADFQCESHANTLSSMQFTVGKIKNPLEVFLKEDLATLNKIVITGYTTDIIDYLRVIYP